MRDMLKLRCAGVWTSAIRSPGQTCILQELSHYASDLAGEPGRNGIAYLMILLRSVSAKKVVIRERLKPCRFTHRQAAALHRVGMDKIVSVLGDVRSDRG